jgi:hypothetical protein
VIGKVLGAQANADGEFIIKDIPAGAYTLKVSAMGHKFKEVDVVVEKEGIVELQIEVIEIGLSDAEAASIPIGSEVSASSDDFNCELVLGSDSLKVGDSLSFVARIRNNSSEKVYLIRFLDGSDAGRFPQVTIEIDGPTGGFEMPSGIARCSIMGALKLDDFSAVQPGDVFEPFKGKFQPIEFEYGRFAQPGQYTVRFTYSTLSDDIRDYQGYPPREKISNVIVKRIDQVPRIEIVKSVSFNVDP